MHLFLYFFLYQDYYEYRKFDEARDSCWEKGATLATINHPYLNNLVASIPETGNGNYWIGFRRNSESG